MTKRGYYHLFSDGFRTDVLFEDKQAFVAGMNIVALSVLSCDVAILSFILMDNHVHFILYGTESECLRFKDRFVHKYAIWYSRRYLSRRAEVLDFDIKFIEDEKYLLTSVAYVLRNGITAGYAYCAEDYPWSSGGLYFRLPERLQSENYGRRLVRDIPVRERRRILQTRLPVPDDWMIVRDGYVWPGSYVDFRQVEKIYRTPKSFAFFMGQSKEEEINRSLGVSDLISLPDIELREKALVCSMRLFRTTDLRRLDVQNRILLAKNLRKDYRCSLKQIARIIHLDPRYLKEWFGTLK